ncbi:S26 family signal peptidase [Actinospica robiniae]|uniref:S26 family signal peptidase n=1 Tax=Actinospica robiniae TaxID=304901 RepID=UPI000688EF8E|nr:S26 family signal peptidase [Actinospica robiniae]
MKVASTVGRAAALTALSALAVAVGLRPVVIEVSGDSMRPTYAPGDRLLAARRPRLAKTGRCVVLRRVTAGDQIDTLAIKRLAAVEGDPIPPEVRRFPIDGGGPLVPRGMIAVLGDGVRSTDSKSYGLIPASSIVAVVLMKLS